MAKDNTGLYIVGGAAIIAAAWYFTRKPAQTQPPVIVVSGGSTEGTGTAGAGSGTTTTPSGTIGGYIQEGTQIIGSLADAWGSISDIFGFGMDAGEQIASEDFDAEGNPIEQP